MDKQDAKDDQDGQDGQHKDEDMLTSFFCPIGQTLMLDPVILESGHSYNRDSIDMWFQHGHHTDPMTNLPVKRRRTRNYALKNAMEEYDVKRNILHQYQRLDRLRDDQQSHQRDLLLMWCDALLASKMNLEVEEEHTLNMKMWYALFKSCNGKMEGLTKVFERHMRTLSCLDGKSLSILNVTLQEMQRSKHLIHVISEYAQQKVQDSPNFTSKQFMHQLLESCQYFKQCSKLWFASDPWCEKVIRKVFEDLINCDDRFPMYLCEHTNDLLTVRSLPLVSEVQIKLAIQKVLFLYDLIIEKDVFERHHELYFGNRLLHGLCASLSLEQKVIDLLRPISGYQWTNKLQGMLNDITNSFFLFPIKTQVPLDLKLCSSGYWPSSAPLPYSKPKALAQAMEQVQKQFRNQFPDRKLIWHMDKGRSEITVSFQTGTYSFIVTTYQMLILLVFNDKPAKITVQQVLKETGVPKAELAHHLLSMVHPKVAILLKRPNTKSLEPNHELMLNAGYTHDVPILVVPLMHPLRKNPLQQEVDKNEDQKLIALQQRHQIDSSICCIMMTRRILKHATLMAEVMCRLKCRFLPRPSLIKKRIEAMIEQEYLERDKQDRSVYHYLP